MADLLPILETQEHRWMRAWMSRDAKALKALTARNFVMLVGAKPAVILDQRSWLEAAGTRFICKSYRFGDVYTRDLGGLAIFASQLDLEAEIDGADWSGRLWVTDLWRKGKVRRTWRMVERILSRTEGDAQVPAAVRGLQLWR